MKLRKALDKAKNERARRNEIEDEKATQFSGASVEFSGNAVPKLSNGSYLRNKMKLRLVGKDISTHALSDASAPPEDEIEWEQPVYANSQTVKINPKVVAGNRGIGINPDAEEIQRYKILRTRIKQLSTSQSINSVMITSANKKEGKTVNAINMAFTFARGMNQTVLLVDCDFTGQDVHRYLGIDNELSLIDYFLEKRPLNELIIWPGIDKLTLISGNRTVIDGSEILASDAMKELVLEMKSRYDDRYVLFDAPPVLEHAEAISMAPLMDGIIMVVEAGVTPEKDVKKALSMLPKEKFLGFLLNKCN